MRFLLLFSLIPLVIHAEESSWQFAEVIGEPVSLDASEKVTVSSFNECMKKCEEDETCILVYQANSSDPCYVFQWNSITEVKKNESGGVGKVAFKLYTDQPACELNNGFLLNGKTYPLHPNDTENNLYKIDSSEDGWKITYIDSRETPGGACGNFTFGRPYVDGCSPECNITMVQVSAKPEVSSNANSTDRPASNWYECMYWCYETPECFVAYFQDGVSTSCTWWAEGDICFLNKTEVTEGHHMAIKLPLSETSCKYGTDKLLNDYSYPEPNPIWNIETRIDGWTIQELPANDTCASMSTHVPYVDGCTPECNVSMIQLTGVRPGPLTLNTQVTNVTATSWRNCMSRCYNKPECFFVHYMDGSSICSMYQIYGIWFMERNVSDVHHMAMKLQINEAKCKMTVDELMNDQYYLIMPGPKTYLQQFHYYNRIRTTDKYYKVKHYTNKEEAYSDEIRTYPGCPGLNGFSGFDRMETRAANRNRSQCFMQNKMPGVTQTEAKSLCEEMDMKLMTDKFTGAIAKGSIGLESGTYDARTPLIVRLYYGLIGGFGLSLTRIKSWYGLEKIDGKWTWANPEFRVFSEDVMPINWGPGEPKDDPEKTCAYMAWGEGQPAFTGYALYSAPCNYTDVDGFSCMSPLADFLGQKQFEEVTAEYGVNSTTCCIPTRVWEREHDENWWKYIMSGITNEYY